MPDEKAPSGRPRRGRGPNPPAPKPPTGNAPQRPATPARQGPAPQDRRPARPPAPAARPNDKRPNDKRPNNSRPNDKRPNNSRPNDPRPSDKRPPPAPRRPDPREERRLREARENDRKLWLDKLDSAVRDLEKPLNTADWTSQTAVLTTMATGFEALKLPGIAAVEERLRGRVFTALLRAGRQTTELPDPVAERARREVHLQLARIWKALAEPHREAVALEAAGRTRVAASLFRSGGEWDELARMNEQKGRFLEAARRFEEHHADRDAARCFKAGADERGFLRCLFKAEDEAAIRAALSTADLELAIATLLKFRRKPLLEEILRTRGELRRLAEFLVTWRRPAEAAPLWEGLAEDDRAAEAWRQAGREAEILRLAETRAAPLLEKGDRLGAARIFGRLRFPLRAAELVRADRPDDAYRWLLEAGHDEEAQELARKEARRAIAQGRAADASHWHEKLGDTAVAAQYARQAGRTHKALQLYEQLGAWQEAAECAEASGQRHKARELYLRAGDHASAARLDAPSAT